MECTSAAHDAECGAALAREQPREYPGVLASGTADASDQGTGATHGCGGVKQELAAQPTMRRLAAAAVTASAQQSMDLQSEPAVATQTTLAPSAATPEETECAGAAAAASGQPLCAAGQLAREVDLTALDDSDDDTSAAQTPAGASPQLLLPRMRGAGGSPASLALHNRDLLQGVSPSRPHDSTIALLEGSGCCR